MFYAETDNAQYWIIATDPHDALVALRAERIDNEGEPVDLVDRTLVGVQPETLDVSQLTAVRKDEDGDVFTLNEVAIDAQKSRVFWCDQW